MRVDSGECRKRILSRILVKSHATLSTIHSQLSTIHSQLLLALLAGLRRKNKTATE
ncbi:MAG: hypothetical protein LBE12_09490 [Planctomycetaceae bacterium]|nr:hypothetical protein [Planctomycetaceae bacterium]